MYPTAVYIPRIKTNLPGVVYQPEKAYVGFVEDITNLDSHVVAIENELGLDPSATYNTVAERLTAIAGHASLTGANAHGDSYLLNTGDTATGQYIFTDNVTLRSGDYYANSYTLSPAGGATPSSINGHCFYGLLKINQYSGVTNTGTQRTAKFMAQNAGSGKAVTLRCLELSILNTAGGTIDNAQALYIGPLAGTNIHAILSNNGKVVFNEGGDADSDFRIEGDTDQNLLFTDASADSVQIGSATTADSAKFYVNGKISTSSEIEINGDLNHDGSNIGFFGIAPTTKQTHIVDADGNLPDITTKFNDLLTKLEAYGLLATS